MCGAGGAAGVRISGKSSARADFKIKAALNASAGQTHFVAAVLGFTS
jgi:hypothetical protein